MDYSRKASSANPTAPRMKSNQGMPTSQGQTTGSSSSRPDPFYGHESVARICSRFITHLFACPEYPPAATHSQAKLPHFIAYALHRTKLHPSVTYAALVLLQRLKARFPTAKGSSGHRLFISAFMIASKVICDDTYSNKSWGIVAQGMFSLREINQMEREMCSYLEWELTVDNPILENFERAVRNDFATDQKTYPLYTLTFVSKRALRASTPVANSEIAPTPTPDRAADAKPTTTTSPIPSFTHFRNASPANSRPSTDATPHRSRPTPEATPSPSYSASTSPASTMSPQTPVGPENNAVRIHGMDASPGFECIQQAAPVHPLKGQMFAFALPSKW